MAAEPQIDPRYAAQFQRGFDPAVHGAVERRGPLRIDVPRDIAHRVAAPPRVEHRPAGPTTAVEEAEEPQVDEDLPAPRPRTEWALLAVGILLPVLAAATWWASVTDPRMYNGFTMSPTDQFLVLVQNYLPGPLLVGGILALLAWIVLRAVGRAR